MLKEKVFLFFLLCFNFTLNFAQTSQQEPLSFSGASGKEIPQRPELTKDDLGAFIDGLLPLQIEQADIAGAVIAVVKDGSLIFAKGYGYADTDKKIPISPEASLFRSGSISKLFTWTAIMQLVEQGKLNLDEDVNNYLDFKIPPTFDKPITMRDMMTHRPGFEEALKDLFVGSVDEIQSFPKYLEANMPARIFPPGAIPAYSNYATALAGYIVERISGLNFNEYIEKNLFNPLEMNHSSFRQPLPESLKAMMSNGYILGSGDPQPFELVQAAPAGSLSASAIDMSHFMIMHLQEGRYKDVQILKPETTIQMHARQSGWPAEMNAMCLGFYEQSENGYRVIGHGGDTALFHSNLLLILKENVGFFISYNSAGKSTLNLRGIVFSKFMDRYFPSVSTKATEVSKTTGNASGVVGMYEASRRSGANFFSILNLFGEKKVSFNSEDNTISMTGFNGLNQMPLRFQEIEPMLFREVGGKAKIAFVKDFEGQLVAYIDYPFMVFQKISKILNKQNVNYSILAFSLIVVILNLLAWPIAAMVRRHYNHPLALKPAAKLLRRLVYVACLSLIIFIIGFVLFAIKLSDISMLSSRNNGWLHLLQAIGAVVGLGALAAICNCIYSWFDRQQWLWSKIWNTCLALACVGFFWFIYHWHLLNFNLKY